MRQNFHRAPYRQWVSERRRLTCNSMESLNIRMPCSWLGRPPRPCSRLGGSAALSLRSTSPKSIAKWIARHPPSPSQNTYLPSQTVNLRQSPPGPSNRCPAMLSIARTSQFPTVRKSCFEWNSASDCCLYWFYDNSTKVVQGWSSAQCIGTDLGLCVELFAAMCPFVLPKHARIVIRLPGLQYSLNSRSNLLAFGLISHKVEKRFLQCGNMSYQGAFGHQPTRRQSKRAFKGNKDSVS